MAVVTIDAQFKRLEPAVTSRQILALTRQLEALAQTKAAPRDYKINTWFNSYPKTDFFQSGALRGWWGIEFVSLKTRGPVALLG